MKGIILAGGSGTRLVSAHYGNVKTASSDLRQADDLLSDVCSDERRHP